MNSVILSFSNSNVIELCGATLFFIAFDVTVPAVQDEASRGVRVHSTDTDPATIGRRI